MSQLTDLKLPLVDDVTICEALKGGGRGESRAVIDGRSSFQAFLSISGLRCTAFRKVNPKSESE